MDIDKHKLSNVKEINLNKNKSNKISGDEKQVNKSKKSTNEIRNSTTQGLLESGKTKLKQEVGHFDIMTLEIVH